MNIKCNQRSRLTLLWYIAQRLLVFVDVLIRFTKPTFFFLSIQSIILLDSVEDSNGQKVYII